MELELLRYLRSELSELEETIKVMEKEQMEEWKIFDESRAVYTSCELFCLMYKDRKIEQAKEKAEQIDRLICLKERPVINTAKLLNMMTALRTNELKLSLR